jgi:hypothetical protein
MLEKFGLKGTEKDGVFFSESAPSNLNVIKHIKVELARQNANLSDLKVKLAQQAKGAGANAIVNFRYGQQSHKWWQHLTFRWDTESWQGEGDAVKL